MNEKLKLTLFIVFAAIGGLSALGGEGSLVQRSLGADYKQNNCVNCHSRITDPLHINNLYVEWEFSAHQPKGIGCEKCHGGDSTISDKEKAHIVVLRRSDSKSRIHWNNQPETCGVCHEDVVSAFKESVHYKRLKDIGLGPSCSNCHVHMATQVIYDPAETGNLCANCHNPVYFTQPRQDIPIQARETVMAMQRADRVIELAQLFITHGQMMRFNLTSEQNEIKLSEEILRQTKVKWHSFNLEGIRKQADEAFLKGTKIKDEVRKKLRAN
ncbi:MAG: hypothetical protein L0220_03810 [Acidobacteria bacterium]|nr:hypothetical protein [Acidobacteriota bacterium]